jgi:four helix bundle protein
MMDYEKLDVYRFAIEHLAFVLEAIPRLPRGHASLADQWRRAAMSIPLNIAEAVGKRSIADRAASYTVARGEAMECGAIVDVVRLLRRVPEEQLDRAKKQLHSMVAMLTKLSA